MPFAKHIQLFIKKNIPIKGLIKAIFGFFLFDWACLYPIRVNQWGRGVALVLLFLSMVLMAEAKHIAGGEMSYKYLGIGAGGKLKYEVILRLYRDCYSNGAIALEDVVAVNVFNNGNVVSILNIPMKRISVVQLSDPGPCIENAPKICYEIGYYSQEIELPVSVDGYILGYQGCCRIENITNVSSSGSAGVTYMAKIPGNKLLLSAPANSSPIFNTSDTVIVCENNSFMYDFSATDVDGDELEYTFQEAYDGRSLNNPKPYISVVPPYTSLQYSFGFSANSPMGIRVYINGQTGWVSGIAPTAGVYVITVVVIERRNGIVINQHRKDLHLKVAACSIAAANLNPEYITCKGYEMTFQNNNVSNLIKTYFWEFGTSIAKDTSIYDKPTFRFPDSGIFRVKLVTNRNLTCSDSAYTFAKIYPGFKPDFNIDNGCKNATTQFIDLTTTAFGNVNSWKWIFGHPTINPDMSTVQNPTYAYPKLGTYNVQLLVSNTKGCVDTLDKEIVVLDKPSIRITSDTLICSIDTLQLNAVGLGSFTWSPNYMINDFNSPNPLVSPDKPTMYYAVLVSSPGCSNIDSVFVDVKKNVSLFAGNDTSICISDKIQLNPISDGTSFQWAPVNLFSDANSKRPIVQPQGKTTYTVKANIGKCEATDEITIIAYPYPNGKSNNDTTLCFGESLQLVATGGTHYIWAPASSLSNNRIANPIAKPTTTTNYIVSILNDNGCLKPTIDTVIVAIIPKVKVFAGNDTSIVLNQPLQLNASGGNYYQWSPTYGLSNPNIANPLVQLSSDVTYWLKVSTIEGCYASDTINIHVFQTAPDIFVPTAFTPNNDKLNDLLIPIPVGIETFDFFKVFNRYGELVFSTTKIGKGWDGKIAGKEQGLGTFSWFVQGTDYTGKRIFKKGTSSLIK